MKKILFLLLFAVLFSDCMKNEENFENTNIQTQRPSLELVTAQDSLNYALGIVLGLNMKQYGINEIDFNLVNNGIADALAENPNFIIKPEDAKRILALYLSKSYKQTQIDYIKKNSDFLIENAKKMDITVLPSGLQYKILTKGNGISPDLDDIVIVNYKGWLIDGTEVGNTFGKKPVRFAVNKSIKGWQIALTMMKEGDKWRIYLPPNLAFGSKGGKKIKPNSVVIYDIELVKVIKR